MANYNFRSQFNFSYSAKPVALRATINIGASGAPTIASGTGMGISSVVRNSAGDYTINLSRAYGGLMGVRLVSVSSAAPAAPLKYVKTNSVSSSSAPSIEIVCTNTSSVATDPASGEQLIVEILLNDSSLAY